MLRPMPIGPIPPETARVARAAFPKGNRYLRVADELETLFTDDAFLALFPTHGQPAQPPYSQTTRTPYFTPKYNHISYVAWEPPIGTTHCRYWL